MSSEHDAMVEVVDGWLRKLYPKVPTWREIAGVVEGLGYSNLAYCLRQVYVTGECESCCQLTIWAMGKH